MKKSIKYFVIAIALVCSAINAQDFSTVWKTRLETTGVSIDTCDIGLLIYKNPPVLRVVLIGHSFRSTLVHEYPICAMGGEYGKRMRMGDGKTPEGFYYTYIPDESTSIQIYRVPKGDTLVKDALMSGIIIHSGCISSDGSIAIADSSFAELRWLLGKQGYVSTLILPFEDDGEYRDRAIVQSVRSNPAEFRHIWFVRALNIIAKGKWFPITMEPGDYATIVSGMPEYTWEYFVDYLPPLIDIPYRAAMLAE